MNTKTFGQIKTRRDFLDAFQEAMGGAHEHLRSHWSFDKEQNLAKSYLVEFHPRSHKGKGHEWDQNIVFSALKNISAHYDTRVSRTEDPTLLILSHEDNKQKAEFVIDCYDPRFLTFHTISNARASDNFILDKLTQNEPEFDRFWFPVALLENTETRERVTGFEAKFDPLLDGHHILLQELQADQSQKNHSNGHSAKPRLTNKPKLSMHIERPDAMGIYKDLKSRVSDLLTDMPLDGVLTERSDIEVNTYAKAHIKSYGKITGRGPDFNSYLQIVNGTLESYANAVTRIEERYWLKLEPQTTDSHQGFSITGQPFTIQFNRLFNMSALLDVMFNCKAPFRLMGNVEQVEEDYFAIDAIDLHINQRVSFEIAPELMRIYLYEGTCGNTVVRILRSLQHHIDSTLNHPSLTE
jgi:hypothetical protein